MVLQFQHQHRHLHQLQHPNQLHQSYQQHQPHQPYQPQRMLKIGLSMMCLSGCPLSISLKGFIFCFVSTATLLTPLNSYNDVIQSNHVNGRVLLTMKTKDDWKELGIEKFGDLRILGSVPVPTSMPRTDASASPSTTTSTSKGKYNFFPLPSFAHSISSCCPKPCVGR